MDRTATQRANGLSLLLAIACSLATITGCQQQLELIPVEGRVLYQGKPLEYGSVMFQPNGNGPLARGTIGADGTFVLGTKTSDDGVRPGVCRVRVTAFAAQRSTAEANAQRELSLGRSAIPAKYQSFGTSGLTVEINPETPQPIVIDLK